jgi:hypothetical protein
VQSFQLVPLAVVVVHFYLFGVSLPILVKDASNRVFAAVPLNI